MDQNKKENIDIQIDSSNKYNFCKSIQGVRKFCLIDSRIREKEAVECDIYTWLIKKINCDPNIDKFDEY